MPRNDALAPAAAGEAMLKAWLWLGIFGVVFVWSTIHPKDRMIWFLEVFPAVVGLVAVLWSYKRFRLTELTYWLILVHCVILMVGGHYTYAEVPLFDRIADALGSERNQYDKLGHLAQGFIPAIIAREILLRRSPLRRGGWLFFLVVCVCLAISAFYELIEWWVALAAGASSEAFLGTQGYVWDTQSDMAYALLGAISAQLLLSRLHDRQLEEFLAKE
jgi:putative membrane protein